MNGSDCVDKKIIFNFFSKEDTLNALCELFDLDRDKVTEFIYGHTNIDTILYDFIKHFKININNYEVDNVYLRCKHVMTAFDNLESLKKYGLLNLADALTCETSLNRFLKENNLEINVKDKYIIYKGQEIKLFEFSEDCRECVYGECKHIRLRYNGTHEISYKNIWCDHRSNLIPLIVKFYCHKSEVEVHLVGDDERILRYSCVRDYPEIFITIQEVLYKLYKDTPQLARSWVNKENMKAYILHFDELISSFESINSSSYLPQINYYFKYADLCGLTSDDVECGDINDCFFSNYYLIDKAISVLLDNCSSLYGQIFPGVKIEWGKLRIQEV